MNTMSVEIELDLLGRGPVIIDGEDVSAQVHGIQIESQVGEIPQIALLTQRPLAFRAETEVTQVIMGLSVDTLRSIPAKALHDKAAELPWGKSEELVANVLKVLEEMIPSGT